MDTLEKIDEETLHNIFYSVDTIYEFEGLKLTKTVVKDTLDISSITRFKFREKWLVKGCNEVVFDIWPGLPIIMEVDCKTEAGLIDVCNKLGLNHNEGFTHSKYNELYGFDGKLTQGMPDLSFKNAKK